jgi:hypothetical protein
MALQMQTFSNFTPAMFTALINKINTDTGQNIAETLNETVTVTHGSFVFTFNYNPTTAVLMIQCLKKPLFISATMIVNGLAEEVVEVIATTRG